MQYIAEIEKQRQLFYEKNHMRVRVNRLSRLPKHMLETGLILIGGQWKKDTFTAEEQSIRQKKALDTLASYSKRERKKLFMAITPDIYQEIEATWQLFDYLPYTTSYSRRPFRTIHASSDKESVMRRCIWYRNLIRAIAGYEQSITWFAAWAAHLGWNAPDALGYLFAGSMNMGGKKGDEVFKILKASAAGTHPLGKMGRHVIRAFLCSKNQEAWQYIQKMLLAAEREEGLRQVILEAVDEAHPQAFRMMLDTILEQNLVRFSASVRAASTWLGLSYEAATNRVVKEHLQSICQYLNDENAIEKSLQEGTAEEKYLALWTIAFSNITKSIEKAKQIINHPDVEHRFIVTYFLAQTRRQEIFKILQPLMNDSDLRVSSLAFDAISAAGLTHDWCKESDLFESLEELIKRLPAKNRQLKPLIWDWMTIKIDRTSYFDGLYTILGNRSPNRLLPYYKSMSPHIRIDVAKLFLKNINANPEYKNTLIELTGDRSSFVSRRIFDLLPQIQLDESDILKLESLLTRKTESTRRGIIELLLKQKDKTVFKSIDRLSNCENELQRLAGLELLREMKKSKRGKKEIESAVQTLQGEDLSQNEKQILHDFTENKHADYSLSNALGLAELNQLSAAEDIKNEKKLFGNNNAPKLGSKAAKNCILSLDKLIEDNSTFPITIKRLNRRGPTELLGNMRWGFIEPDPSISREENIERFEFKHICDEWYQNRDSALRDDDGYEFHRADVALDFAFNTNSRRGTNTISKYVAKYLDEPYDFSIKHRRLIVNIINWIIYLYPVQNEIDFLLDAYEETCKRIEKNPDIEKSLYQDVAQLSNNQKHYLTITENFYLKYPERWNEKQLKRLWGMYRWFQNFMWKNQVEEISNINILMPCYSIGAANTYDLYYHFIGSCVKYDQNPDKNKFVIYAYQSRIRQRRFQSLRNFSTKRIHPLIRNYPILEDVIQNCRDKILEIELLRGDLPTIATSAAHQIQSLAGIDYLIQLLTALGTSRLSRDSWGEGRLTTISHLIRVSYPLETDTAEDFARKIKSANIPEENLINTALYAPQWAEFVEFTLGWNSFSEGVWWIFAHTRDSHWSVEKDIKEAWAAQVSEYTPLTAERLLEGAVDVDWFHKTYTALGEERWKKIYQAASFASGGTGHARARLFSDAMLNKLEIDTLIKRIQNKRYQDAVRALGLIPLPEDNTRQAEILRRYEIFQDFLRPKRKIGSQRKASEKLATEIAMENLARTAGFVDPIRLEWAMELEAISDLSEGPIIKEVEGVIVKLLVNDLGEINLDVWRGERKLKNIPPKVKKNPDISALLERKKQLEKQTSRMRLSLENAMVRGDEFTAKEIKNLFQHPILKVMMEQLIFIGPNGMGYPIENGMQLESLAGSIPISEDDSLRIAHPYDLLITNEWPRWQHECFVYERIQPFKQVFRELYVLTDTEKEENNVSRRYAGHQVQPRQSMGLFSARGWVTSQEEGVFKTFHKEGIVARVGALHTPYTAAEVEDVTIEEIGFTHKGQYKTIPLDEIPPRMFSEVMRDLDLVVSVAHAGGFDPEASASTVESRAALVHETSSLLNISNTTVENRHVIVDGKMAKYTIHLGSGVVHKQPGGSLCIIPVHGQHRGRLFLPFVDDDPKTAEIISKVLLLANDEKIKDPTILEQIL